MEQAIADALAEVKALFARYPKPLNVSYCSHCFAESEIARLFAIPTEKLTADDLDRFLFKSYTTWGAWPDLAYYVPRLLELSVSDDPPDGDMLLYKLLVTVQADPDNLGMNTGPGMRAEERQAIFRFMLLVSQHAVGTEKYPYAMPVYIPYIVAFLAAFDQPIAPFLQQWQQSEKVLARANLCAFMSDYLLNDRPRNRVLKNIFADSLTILPENQVALDVLLSPSFVTAYLSKHAVDVKLLGQEQEREVGLAFDWAVQQERALEP